MYTRISVPKLMDDGRPLQGKTPEGWALRFKARGLGFRVEGLGFGVYGLGIEV